MKWISSVLGEAISAAQSTGLIVDPRIYITSSSPPTPPTPPATAVAYDESDKGSISLESPITEKDVNMSLPSYSALRILNGRPSVRKILQEEIGASSGPVSVDGMCMIMTVISNRILMPLCSCSFWPIQPVSGRRPRSCFGHHQSHECTQRRSLRLSPRGDFRHEQITGFSIIRRLHYKQAPFAPLSCIHRQFVALVA